MNIKTVVLKGLGVADEPIVAVPIIGIMTLRQTAILFVSFFVGYLMFNQGFGIYIPIVVVVALYLSFVKGKAFTPSGTIGNYFSYLGRTFMGNEDNENKLIEALKRKEK